MKEHSRFAEGLEKIWTPLKTPAIKWIRRGDKQQVEMVKCIVYGRCNKDLLVAILMYREC